MTNTIENLGIVKSCGKHKPIPHYYHLIFRLMSFVVLIQKSVSNSCTNLVESNMVSKQCRRYCANMLQTVG